MIVNACSSEDVIERGRCLIYGTRCDWSKLVVAAKFNCHKRYYQTKVQNLIIPSCLFFYYEEHNYYLKIECGPMLLLKMKCVYGEPSFDGKVICSLFFCILMQILVDDTLSYIQVSQCINSTLRFVINFNVNCIIEKFANSL